MRVLHAKMVADPVITLSSGSHFSNAIKIFKEKRIKKQYTS